MRRAVAGLLAGLMLFTPTFQAVGDDIRIEVKGDLYDRLALPKGAAPGDLPLFQGRFGAGLNPSVGACGINALQSYITGLSDVVNLSGLKDFITHWQNAATAVFLYGLATYLPVAKEVLLGANMLSNFVAQLRGFSCTQAMEAIKELNYRDSYLVKRCMANQLKVSVEELDLQDPKTLKIKYGDNWAEKWQAAYNYCLNKASLVDLLGGQDEAQKYLSFISPRSLARCYLGVKENFTSEDIANGDLQTRAKYFLYMVLPDITMDADGIIRIKTVRLEETQDGRKIIYTRGERGRPMTLADAVNLHAEDFENNFSKLIENLKREIKYETDYEEALKIAKRHLKDFERKYGIVAEDMAGILILVLKMRDFMVKEITASGEVDEAVLQLALMPIDNVLSDIKEHFRYRVIESLRNAIYEHALRLREAEEMRRAVGSVATPGGKDGCLTGASASQ
jgi:hypothetical protein